MGPHAEPTSVTIGFVTHAEVGSITPDDRLIVEALAKLGVSVRAVCWDDGEPPQDVDAFVLRSPWNYHLTPESFLAWVDRAGDFANVYNNPGIVRWNSHKGYLLELGRAGIPIAPTVLCRKREASDLTAIMAQRAWSQVIVKPAISASSFMTSIVGVPASMYGDSDVRNRIVEDGQRALESILETGDALVQPFMPEVLQHGERCLVFIDGQFSHAVKKAPFTHVGGGGQSVIAGCQEIEIGRRVLSLIAETTLYARVDLLRGTDGIDRLMELELIDPELYMRFDADSPERFASALMRQLGSST